MRTFTVALLSLTVLSACTLLMPYNITFTTPDNAVIDPATDTLDLALNQEALAYISWVQCDDDGPIGVLPTTRDDVPLSKAYNLPLTILATQEIGAECEVEVTAYDRSTTATSKKSITLFVLDDGKEVEEEPEEELPVDEDPEPEEPEEFIEDEPELETEPEDLDEGTTE